MGSLAFWKSVVADRSNFLERIFEVLESEGFAYCVIGGVAVNVYVTPLLTEDLDIAVESAQLSRARTVLGEHFKIREFEHSINVYDPESGLQVQIQKDPAINQVIVRAQRMDVFGMTLPVATPDDLVRLKVIAASDPARRNMKKGKDRLDLARLLTAFPDAESLVPPELLERVRENMDQDP